MSAAADRDRNFLVHGGFALALVIVIVSCQPWNLFDQFMIGAPLGRDFVNFWLGGRLALDGRLDLLSDLLGYNALIVDRFGHSAEDFFVFSYPPNILPFLVPFGALPYVPALVVWTALNLALLAWTAWSIGSERRAAVAACLSPATVMMVTYGHFGGLLAALATFAITRAQRKPALAGLCLALISVKPQLAAVLGLLMLLIGHWRAVAWSLPGAAALIGLSALLFGPAPWVKYIEVTVPFHTWLIGNFVPDHLRTMLSLYAAARLEGVSFGAAGALQLGFGLAVIAAAALLTRRDGLNPRTLALLLLAALGAQTYFQHYDLAIVAPALSVALFDGKPGDARPFLTFVPASLLWLSPPASIPFGTHSPVVNLVVAGVLVVALVRQWRLGARPNRAMDAAVGEPDGIGALRSPSL